MSITILGASIVIAIVITVTLSLLVFYLRMRLSAVRYILLFG
jgi:hypothetical protein